MEYEEFIKNRFKSEDISATVPIIALMQADRDSRLAFYKYGIQDYLMQPILSQELLFRVKACFLAISYPTTPSFQAVLPILIQSTCFYLQEHLDQKLFLDDISMAMGTNRTKLAKEFKQALGVGVFEWLRQQRMYKAKSLLSETQMSIQQIAFAVGYENCGNFSTVYRKYFNLSPRQQRNKLRDQT